LRSLSCCERWARASSRGTNRCVSSSGLQRRKARDDAKRARQQTEQDKPTGGRRGELTPAKTATRRAYTDDGTVERRKRMPGVNAEGKRHQGQTTILPKVKGRTQHRRKPRRPQRRTQQMVEEAAVSAPGRTTRRQVMELLYATLRTRGMDGTPHGWYEGIHTRRPYRGGLKLPPN